MRWCPIGCSPRKRRRNEMDQKMNVYSRGNPNPSPATRFKPGQSGNPQGRTNHAKREAGERCWKALLADFIAEGEAAIARFREANPGGYVQLVASGLPSETK